MSVSIDIMILNNPFLHDNHFLLFIDLSRQIQYLHSRRLSDSKRRDMNTDRIGDKQIHVSNGSNFLEFGCNAIFRGSWADGSGEFPGLSELVSMETTPKPIQGAFVRTFTLVEARLQHSPYPLLCS